MEFSSYQGIFKNVLLWQGKHKNIVGWILCGQNMNEINPIKHHFGMSIDGLVIRVLLSNNNKLLLSEKTKNK